MQAGEPGQPIWLVDPNDGTRDYLVGRRGSAVSIGLVRDGRPVLGVVFAFAYPDDAGDLFAWAEGTGPLRRNGRPLDVQPRPRARPDGRRARLQQGRPRSGGEPAQRGPRALPEPAPRSRTGWPLVAAGEAAGATSLFAPCAWDYGAGDALVRAAGGCVVDESGRAIAYDATGDSRSRRAFGGAPEVAGALADAAVGRSGRRVGRGASREAAARRGDRGRGSPRPRAGLPPGPDRGRQPGRLVEFAVRGRDPPRVSGRAAAPRRRRALGPARRPADRRQRDGAGAGALDRGRRRATIPRGPCEAYREWLASVAVRRGPHRVRRAPRTAR